MNCHHRILVLSLLVSLAGCGGVEEADFPQPTPEFAQRRTEIVGGTVDNGSPAVVSLAVPHNGGFVSFCTGTLIAPKTILTAAHCVYSYGTDAPYYAVFGTYVSSPTHYMRIVQQVRHPTYSSGSLQADIAVLRLESPVFHTQPVNINTQQLNNTWVGKPIRHSGFGVTQANTNTSGTKRQGTWGIRQLSATEIESGQSNPLKQTCSGDSGGPGFIVLPGTTEEVVAGVVSYGDQTCTQFGVDTNVAYYASWVQQTMGIWEAPTCAEDGKCAANCAQPDIDCVCAKDGVCSAECPDFSKDADCPADCATNNVCAQDVCPRPDEDCRPEGLSCTSELQCVWRKCVGDAQHSYNYCSRPCSNDSECSTVDGMVCAGGACRYEQKATVNIGQPCNDNSYCLLGGICIGETADDTHCALPCNGPGTCPGVNQTCAKGYNGQTYCKDPEGTTENPEAPKSNAPVYLHNARVEGRQASTSPFGCSATGGSGGPGLVWLAGVALVGMNLLRRRRLRRGGNGNALALSVAAVGALGALGVGCGPTLDGADAAQQDDASATARSEIVGGSTTFGDPEVFMLRMIYGNGSASSCTATLIGEQTLLTAAHCVDPAINNADTVTIFATNQTYANSTPQQQWIRITEYRMHPGWNRETLQSDIALALLQVPPGVQPKMWNRESLWGKQGAPIRAVGYGITSRQKSDSGTKRHVELTIAALQQSHLFLGDQMGKGICSGDSGGPTFHTFPDGRERIIGVHSFDGNGVCTYGGDIRTDAYETFIDEWMAEKEAPTCTTDGRCLGGCVPADLDCYCVPDNACDARCPNLLSDPDCPADCVQNGVCSLQACPVPDPDCVPDGLVCMSPMVCTGRLCTTDPQRDNFYCSRQCTDDANCVAGMACYDGACRFFQRPEADEGESCKIDATYCRNDTECSGLEGEQTFCQRTCSANSECTGKQTCEYGQGFVRFCQEPRRPPVTVTPLQADYKLDTTSGGCSAAPGGMLGLLGIAVVFALPRRRR